MVAASRQIRRKVATTTFNDKVIGFYRVSKHTYVLDFLQLYQYGTIMPYGQQKNEFEWNLLNALRTDVLMMRYTYLEVRIHYLEVRISQLARLCSILQQYTIVII